MKEILIFINWGVFYANVAGCLLAVFIGLISFKERPWFGIFCLIVAFFLGTQIDDTYAKAKNSQNNETEIQQILR